MTAKEKKEYQEYLGYKEKPKKYLYQVEIFEENKDHEPVAMRHLSAKDPADARRALSHRAIEEARIGKNLLSYLLTRDDVTIVVKQIENTRSVAKKERKKMTALHSCQQCGGPLDDDYCGECGWRRLSWIDRAMEKQGQTEIS